MKRHKDMREVWIEGTKVCVGELGANREKLDAVVVHEEAPLEQAAMETFKALKKRHGDRHLVVRSSGKLKIRTQGKGRCRQ
jgi:hypothetical protein